MTNLTIYTDRDEPIEAALERMGDACKALLSERDAARRSDRAEGLREASVIADEVGTHSRTDLWTAEEIVWAINARAEEVERHD